MGKSVKNSSTWCLTSKVSQIEKRTITNKQNNLGTKKRRKIGINNNLTNMEK